MTMHTAVRATTRVTPAAALLDAMPDATAVLDHSGVIVAVNSAWTMFTLDNGGRPESTGVGVSYLDVCERAAAAGCEDAMAVCVALSAVLANTTVECDLEYPCPSPAVGRWFVLRATPIFGSQPGALISHTNISARKTAEQVLERKASLDALTGLANRAQLTERLTLALTPRSGRQRDSGVGLLFLDLDRFKPVNDTYGHAAGDEVLQVSAARLRQLTRPEETVARVGGDEFVILAPRASREGIQRLAERVSIAIEAPHLIHGQCVTVGASVGVYLAAVGEGAAECLNHADEAMYAVKRARPEQARRRDAG